MESLVGDHPPSKTLDSCYHVGYHSAKNSLDQTELRCVLTERKTVYVRGGSTYEHLHNNNVIHIDLNRCRLLNQMYSDDQPMSLLFP